MDTNYKPNSHRSKEEARNNASEKPKLEKVIKGNARTKKQSPTSKLASVFISEDASNVKSYIFGDVVVPAIKKLVTDIVKDGIDMLLNGGPKRDGGRSSGYRADRFAYDKCSRDDYRSSAYSRTRSGYVYDNVTVESRGDAEAVLDRLDEWIREYGLVSVADLYDVAGIRDIRHTDHKYGWTDIRSAEIIRVGSEYLIKMPRVVPLN